MWLITRFAGVQVEDAGVPETSDGKLIDVPGVAVNKPLSPK
jgi:hypothetical protein